MTYVQVSLLRNIISIELIVTSCSRHTWAKTQLKHSLPFKDLRKQLKEGKEGKGKCVTEVFITYQT